MKYHDQRIRELEAEILALQLSCAQVARAIREQGQTSELCNAFVRLHEKGMVAINEWRRLSNPRAALH